MKGGASLTELRLFVASAAELQELSPAFEGSVSPCEAEVRTQETSVQLIAALPSRPKLAFPQHLLKKATAVRLTDSECRPA